MGSWIRIQATLLTNKTKMHLWMILPLTCQIITIFKDIIYSSNRIWSICQSNLEATKIIYLIRIANRTHFKMLRLTIYSHPKVTNNLNVNLSWYKSQNRPKIYQKHIHLTIWLQHQSIKEEMSVHKIINVR
jgi:hypothetical protein